MIPARCDLIKQASTGGADERSAEGSDTKTGDPADAGPGARYNSRGLTLNNQQTRALDSKYATGARVRGTPGPFLGEANSGSDFYCAHGEDL